jgi:hypothetical protein
MSMPWTEPEHCLNIARDFVQALFVRDDTFQAMFRALKMPETF